MNSCFYWSGQDSPLRITFLVSMFIQCNRFIKSFLKLSDLSRNNYLMFNLERMPPAELLAKTIWFYYS